MCGLVVTMVIETMRWYDVCLSDKSMAVLADRTVEIRTSMPNDMIDDVAFAVLTLWTCDTLGRGWSVPYCDWSGHWDPE